MLKHHTDNGGELENMHEINAEYDLLFDCMKVENQSYNKSHSYDEKEKNQAFKDVVNTILSYKIEIEIIGSWIWCFESYDYKDKLKEIGFKFAPMKKAWCGPISIT